MKQKSKISPGEMEIFEILWEKGPLTARRLQEAIVERGHVVQYPTVHTRLDRMLEKGLVVRERDYGGAYRPLLNRKDVSGKLYDLIENLCCGSIAPLMLHLMNKRRLHQDEIDVMEKILVEMREIKNNDGEIK